MFYRSALALAMLASVSAPAMADTAPAKPAPAIVQAAAAENPFARAPKVAKPVQPIPAGLHCTDAVVWASKNSKVYHVAGSRYYGTSKTGQYGCLAQALSAGLTASNH